MPALGSKDKRDTSLHHKTAFGVNFLVSQKVMSKKWFISKKTFEVGIVRRVQGVFGNISPRVKWPGVTWGDKGREGTPKY